MKTSAAERMALERALQSINPLWLLMAALWVAVFVMWFSLLPHAKRQWTTQNQDLQGLRDQVAQAPVVMSSDATPVTVPGQDFQAVLGQVSEIEQYVGSLLNLSQTLEMPAVTGEYKLSCDAATRLCRYRIRLPLVGSYLQIRAFVEQSLLELPFASLDELSLRREGIASGELEAGLTFSLHLAYPVQGVHDVKEMTP
jgi:FAD/FMN-containing dehydrogenase